MVVQFKDFEVDSSWGGMRPRTFSTAVEKLNAWIASEAGIRVLSVETITWLGDAGGWSDKPFERGVRVWYAPA